ncbi:transposase [Tamaricihabitans halophyticus]|uniref:Transposase n=1 Tax=Tamaricihabitans halophyticus TaxID=1262583 RepID=A0A4V2SSG2_9PSEU|nr:IS110 family transposase [Tamaricihabitans halophyticus]TCP46776.1 transposase [Tamaricihabitans halophyticus]
MTTIAHDSVEVTGGVDTHKDTHTVVAVDMTGRVLGTAQFPANSAGYARLLSWLRSFGTLVLVGVEGTGVYGSGLVRYLTAERTAIVEVDRPNRATRRRRGKSDPIDAEAAAQAALSARGTSIPKDRDGRVEALRNLRVARRSAITQRADTQRRMKALIVTAPDTLRQRLRALSDRQLIHTCATTRPDRTRAADPTIATTLALRHLARRHQQLTTDITELDDLIAPLVHAINPHLCHLSGVGPDVAGQLLVTAGDNTHRLHSEAAFAMLCGAAPLPASSGNTHRHRLNRGGDRQANAALHRIALCRLRWDHHTRNYAQQRTHQGKTKKEIIRCLKRYIAREIYNTLNQTTPHTPRHP